eukprot:CAMPEP_0113938188 /NCGR_PEP_ID=MMETSP1339-20121228/4598_1 /TAXON_ID=94617 /ORGANISM="Fibrocapsa japonica" /LENGTH=613 /DNA_ID=CAMNT_0000941181 /DNA_START=341 /DNA_END=2182 /DNA_ORIENTATION=+ /assembly_acc=CAM_ASM_000762
MPIATPNIDRLASEGIVLDSHYVLPVCTPTRSALLTGKYPIRTGLQHWVILPDQPYGLPLEEKILPQYLKDLGYRNHMVGKWHLGMVTDQYTPTARGFDSFFGFLTDAEHYYNHTNDVLGIEGYDFWDGRTPVALDYEDQHSMPLYQQRALEILDSHNPDTPLFLYLALQAPHEPLEPLEEDLALYPADSYPDPARRRYSALVTSVDRTMGAVVQTLKNNAMWEDTLLVFSADNGGNVHAGASNWPLRGSKKSLWEGGTRSVTFVAGGSPLLQEAIPTSPPAEDQKGEDQEQRGEGEGGTATTTPVDEAETETGSTHAAIHGPLFHRSRRKLRSAFKFLEGGNAQSQGMQVQARLAHGDWLSDDVQWTGTTQLTQEGGQDKGALLSDPSGPGVLRRHQTLMHVVDWMPTLYKLAGGRLQDLPKDLDGMDLWEDLTSNAPSHRTEMLYNYDPVWKCGAVRKGSYKLTWHGNCLENSPEQGWWIAPPGIHQETKKPSEADEAMEYFLVNLDEDPLEEHDIKNHNPAKMVEMLELLQGFQDQAVPDLFSAHPGDPRSHPGLNGGNWQPWVEVGAEEGAGGGGGGGGEGDGGAESKVVSSIHIYFQDALDKIIHSFK